LEENKKIENQTENVWYAAASAIIYTSISLMISYNITAGTYIAISLLSLGLFTMVLLFMSKTIVVSNNQTIDIKTEFIRLVTKFFPILVIYQLYLLDYVFFAGMFAMFSILSISTSLAKMMGKK
jgi:hypothetical protein